jgi:hypothetical protein
MSLRQKFKREKNRMRKYLALALLALVLAGILATGGVTAFMTLETQLAAACTSVGC